MFVRIRHITRKYLKQKIWNEAKLTKGNSTCYVLKLSKDVMSFAKKWAWISTVTKWTLLDHKEPRKQGSGRDCEPSRRKYARFSRGWEDNFTNNWARRILYQVMWYGYVEKTWEPSTNLRHIMEKGYHNEKYSHSHQNLTIRWRYKNKIRQKGDWERVKH